MTFLLAAMAAATAAGTVAGTGGPRRRLRLRPAEAVTRAVAVAAGAVTAVAWRIAGRPLGPLLAAVLAAGVFLPVLRARRLRRRRTSVETDVVVMCFAAAAELRTGRSPGEALGAIAAQLGPLSDGVRSAARAVRRGARVEDELSALAEQARSPRLETVAAVWAAVAGTGAGIADVLDRVGQAFAADDEARAELGALAAGPRATAVVLCALPLFALALGAAIGADPTAVLLRAPFGWLLVALAAALDVCGVVWVRAITTRALTG